MSTYGAYKYESQQSRALKSITADSYNKDQAKNLIQLNQNTAYMAGYLRKLQRGVDDANQNIIEQLHGFIQDIFVLVGGGSATGFDFGDMKYVFQSWGALFGLTDSHGNLQLPVNLFQAAWHFFSTYILGFGTSFGDVIDGIIDGALGAIISWLGDIPIIGGAVNQLAVWISDLRDFAHLLNSKFWDFIDNITDGIGEMVDYLGYLLQRIYDTWIQPIVNMISTAIGGPLGKAFEWIQNVISTIFNLASGADTKASNMLKKATPLWESIDGNGEVSFLISTADTLMTINSTNARGAFIRCRGGDLKQTISHVAQKSGTVSSYYLDIYRVGLDYSATKIYTTPDLSASLSTSLTVIFYQMADADAYITSQDENYLVVARMTGSGSVSIQGRVYPVATNPNRPLYPGIDRNPSVTASPVNFTTADLDAIYVKETPYFQIGTLADIVPQSFFVDFTTISDTLWNYKTAYISGFGSVNKLTAKDGHLYLGTGGSNANGRSSITFKYRTNTNRCRIGMHLYDALNTTPLWGTAYSVVDNSNAAYIRLTNTTLQFGRSTGINSFNTAVASATFSTGWGRGLASIQRTGDWIWLEFDPDDGHWRVYLNPKWDDPDLRTMTTPSAIYEYDDYDSRRPPYNTSGYHHIEPGRCILDYDGNTNVSPGVTFNSTIPMDSLSRNAAIIETAAAGNARSAMLDNWKWEDWAVLS